MLYQAKAKKQTSTPLKGKKVSSVRTPTVITPKSTQTKSGKDAPSQSSKKQLYIMARYIDDRDPTNTPPSPLNLKRA